MATAQRGAMLRSLMVDEDILLVDKTGVRC
jgi:hypothetical protein